MHVSQEASIIEATLYGSQKMINATTRPTRMTSRRRSRRLFSARSSPWTWEQNLVEMLGDMGAAGERKVFVVSLSDGWEDITVEISGAWGVSWTRQVVVASLSDGWEDVAIGISGASWFREVAVKRLIAGCISRDSWIREIVVTRLIVVWEELLGDWRIGSTPWRRLDVAEGLAVGSEDVWLA